MWFAVWMLGIAAALPLAGCLYQQLGDWRDRRHHVNNGRFVTLGDGRSLYFIERGSGSPTVLFEAGIGATSLNWLGIQLAVASLTRTISYDRAGLGWSSPSRTARTPGNVAAELHEMLQRARIDPPYVLVGHSFGGLVMRRYALLYPKDVAGVVLVDPMRCEEWAPFTPDRQTQLTLARRLLGFAAPIALCGIARLALTSLLCGSGKLCRRLASTAGENCRHVLERIEIEVGKMPREVRPVVVAHWSRPRFYAAMRDYLAAIPDSVREMHEAEPILETPVMVLTPGKSTPLSEQDLGRIGNRVQQAIAPASEHWIHLDEPDMVIGSIRSMVTACAPERAATAK